MCRRSESVAASSLEAYPPPILKKMLTYISNAAAASTSPSTRLFIRPLFIRRLDPHVARFVAAARPA